MSAHQPFRQFVNGRIGKYLTYHAQSIKYSPPDNFRFAQLLLSLKTLQFLSTATASYPPGAVQ